MEPNIERLLKDYKDQKEETWLMNVMNLNMDLMEQLQTQKTRAKMKRMATGKIITIIIGILWALFLAVLVIGNGFRNPYFGISIGAILLINVAAIIMYIQHVVLIMRINYSSSIVATQQKLSKLQLSTLTMTRILFLQMPFWTTFFWHPSWIIISDWHFWLVPLPITLLFAYSSLWLFMNIRIENKDKKWFGYLFRGPSWTPIVEAQDFLKEIRAFKNE